MKDTIFTDRFPQTDADEKADEKLEAETLKYPDYDSYYVASGCIKERKEKFDQLWLNFKPYADRHFLTQVKKCFHQRTWEMYIGNVLLIKKLQISSADEGPDFISNNDTYIECVAPTKGEPAKTSSVPEVKYATNPADAWTQEVPTDQMILRITQAIKDKSFDQYEKWKSKKWFKKDAPFVIAINTGFFEHPQSYFGIPIVIKALFGLGYLQVDQNGNQSFSWRDTIEKGDGVPVKVNMFTNEQMGFISGVIFSNKTVLNHPNDIGDDCIFINNPFAANPVPKDITEKFKNWHVTKTEKGINIKKGYNNKEDV